MLNVAQSTCFDKWLGDDIQQKFITNILSSFVLCVWYSLKYKKVIFNNQKKKITEGLNFKNLIYSFLSYVNIQLCPPIDPCGRSQLQISILGPPNNKIHTSIYTYYIWIDVLVFFFFLFGWKGASLKKRATGYSASKGIVLTWDLT